VSDNSVLKAASYDTKQVLQNPMFEIDPSLGSVLALEVDFQDKIWMAFEDTLLVLNQEFIELSRFDTQKGRGYNEISIPNCPTICFCSNKVELAWYENNYQISIINTKSMEVMRKVNNIVKNSKAYLF